MLDLGETLVRYFDRSEFPEVLAEAIVEVTAYLRRSGMPVPQHDTVRDEIQGQNYEAKDYRVRPLEERLARIFQLDGALATPELLMEMCNCFMKPVFARSCLFDDTIPVLSKLKELKFRTIIVSNTAWGSPANLWRADIERHGIHAHVDDMVFCRDAGWRKPAPQVFEFALNRLGVDPGQCIFVGDNLKWDIEGPRAVGFEAILIDRNGAGNDAGEEPIRDLYELVDRVSARMR